MTKSELVHEIAKETGLTQKETAVFINGFINVVGKSLKKNEKIHLSGLGVFETVKREARDVRNPKTGNFKPVEAYYVPKFRFCTGLKADIRGKE